MGMPNGVPEEVLDSSKEEPLIGKDMDVRR